MAMRLMTLEEYRAAIAKLGFQRCQEQFGEITEFWKDNKGNIINVPLTDEKIPDSILEYHLRQINRLYEPRIVEISKKQT